MTAYDELVNNARQHGREPVAVKAAVWAGRILTLRVKDAGRGFQANRRLRVLRVFPRTMLALQADLVAAGKQDRFPPRFAAGVVGGRQGLLQRRWQRGAGVL